MDRLVRLTSLWSWLPTFRAVAEHQHVSRAAEQLGVSPSAVSRMIGLLEDDVGQPLFERAGRSIHLNAAGEHLLSGVRSAMRLVDESLAVMAGKQFVGRVRVASAEPVTRLFVLPALAALRARHPALVAEIRSVSEADVATLLLSGQLDVVFARHALRHEQLSTQRMGELNAGVYAGSGHPLCRSKKKLRPTDLLSHAFVTLLAEHTPGASGWPAGYRRQVAMTVETVDVAAELCAQGEMLAVLPDVVAARYRRQGGELARLPFDAVKPSELFASWRKRLELPGRAEAVVDAVKAQFEAFEPATMGAV
jgi:DNA-binding transcriptional LysR family regulator